MLRTTCLLLYLLFWAQPAAAQFPGCPLITQITLEECQTLEKLFFETDGPNWRNVRGWMRSNQPCDWFGITCLSSAWPRKVTKIDLSANNLTGSLPGELSLLTELREIRIDNSGPGVRFKKLTGTLPAVIGQLEHLEVLQLGNNEFTGTIPPEYGKLMNLREFSLADNALTGPIPEALANLGSLEKLDLSGNELAGRIPALLGNLLTLTSLNLSHNRLTGPVPESLGSLEALRLLNLSGNELEGSVPQELTQLDKLIWLSLANNRLEGALPLSTATFATRINTCELGGNQICVPDAPPYASLSGETVCGLVRKASCKACTTPECATLEALYMSANGPHWKTSDSWLASSAPCDWHGVSCSSGRITGLALDENNLSGRLPASLAELRELNGLDVSGNSLRGRVPAAFGALHALRSLNLSRNQLTGSVPIAVATLGASLVECDFTENTGLCIPNGPEYAALGNPEVCGLRLQPLCAQSEIVAFGNLVAEPLESSVRLTWIAEAPAATIIFEVELVHEAEAEFVGSVQGLPEAPTAYEYMASGLSAGTYTFRIRQKSLSGAFSLSESVTVTLLEPRLVIEGPFPNPFDSNAVLHLSTGSRLPVSISLYDLAGRHIRTLFQGTPTPHVSSAVHIPGDGLPSGTYLVRVIADGAPVRASVVHRVR